MALISYEFVAPPEVLRGYLPWTYGVAVLGLPTARNWLVGMRPGKVYRLKMAYALDEETGSGRRRRRHDC